MLSLQYLQLFVWHLLYSQIFLIHSTVLSEVLMHIFLTFTHVPHIPPLSDFQNLCTDVNVIRKLSATCPTIKHYFCSCH